MDHFLNFPSTLQPNDSDPLLHLDILLEKALSDFDVIDNGKEKVILSTIYNGFTSELAAYQFDYKTGQWVQYNKESLFPVQHLFQLS